VELRAKLEEQAQDPPTLDTSSLGQPRRTQRTKKPSEKARENMRMEDAQRGTRGRETTKGPMRGNGREVIWRPEDESQGERYVVSVGR